MLTLNLVGEITGKRGGASKECLAQGGANPDHWILWRHGRLRDDRSVDDQREIGRSYATGWRGGSAVLAWRSFSLPLGLIEQIPLAALIGVMFMVVIGTFAWRSLMILRRIPLSDSLVMILVTAVTVAEDLAIAVIVGVIVSALVYAWGNATRISANTSETVEGGKVYALRGPLFFGSAEGFSELFNPAQDPDLVIVDFAESRVVDQSALQVIEAVAGRYEQAGKRIQLRHLSRDCHQLLSKAGHLMVDSDDDPDYEIAADYSVRTGILGGH